MNATGTLPRTELTRFVIISRSLQISPSKFIFRVSDIMRENKYRIYVHIEQDLLNRLRRSGFTFVGWRLSNKVKSAQAINCFISSMLKILGEMLLTCFWLLSDARDGSRIWLASTVDWRRFPKERENNVSIIVWHWWCAKRTNSSSKAISGRWKRTSSLFYARYNNALIQNTIFNWFSWSRSKVDASYRCKVGSQLPQLYPKANTYVQHNLPYLGLMKILLACYSVEC